MSIKSENISRQLPQIKISGLPEIRKNEDVEHKFDTEVIRVPFRSTILQYCEQWSILISFDAKITIVGNSSEILSDCASLLFVVFYYGKSKCQNTHFLKHDVVMKSFHYLSFLTCFT